MLETELSKRIRLLNMQLLSNKELSFYHFSLKKEGKIVREESMLDEDGKVIKTQKMLHQLDLDHEILVSSFVLNFQNATVIPLTNDNDSFQDVLQQEIKGKKLSLKKQKELWVVSADDTPLLALQGGKLVELNLPTTKKLGDKFLFSGNTELRALRSPVLEEAGHFCLTTTPGLKILDAPHLKRVGNMFCYCAQSLETLNLPALEEAGHMFCFGNEKLTPQTMYLPKLKKTGIDFIRVDSTLPSRKVRVKSKRLKKQTQALKNKGRSF